MEKSNLKIGTRYYWEGKGALGLGKGTNDGQLIAYDDIMASIRTYSISGMDTKFVPIAELRETFKPE